jgi:hypothetical protein
MRRIFGAVLIGLGAFGLVLAVLLPTVVVPGSKKIPLDLDITLHSTGTAKLLDPATNKVRDVNLLSTQVVRTDTHASDSKNTTVDESLCTVIVEGTTPDCVSASDPRLLSLTTDRLTADRKTAEAVRVAKYSENVNGDTGARHTGLGYTFPIDSKKQTYQFYAPDLLKAYPAVYKGTSKLKGLTVYEYVSETGTQPYQVAGLFPGTYTDTRTVWVEPRTGVIVKGMEHQVQALLSGQVALDTTLTFDAKAIDFQANYAKDKIRLLNLAELWGPIAAALIGIGALVVGYLLLRARRNRDGDAGGEPLHGEPTPDDVPNYAPAYEGGPLLSGSSSGSSQT